MLRSHGLLRLDIRIGHGPNIAPAEPGAERTSFADVILKGRLQEAIHRLNPQIPEEAQEEALRKVLRLESSTFVGNNRAFHKMLRDGVEVEYRRSDGSIAGDHVRLLDFSEPAAIDWFVVNQFTGNHQAGIATALRLWGRVVYALSTL